MFYHALYLIITYHPCFYIYNFDLRLQNFQVFKAQAHDDDGDQLKFTILETSQPDYFWINQSTGVVSSNKLFTDVSPGSIFALTLRVEDDGFPNRHSDLLLVVEVAGENRNR